MLKLSLAKSQCIANIRIDKYLPMCIPSWSSQHFFNNFHCEQYANCRIKVTLKTTRTNAHTYTHIHICTYTHTPTHALTHIHISLTYKHTQTHVIIQKHKTDKQSEHLEKCLHVNVDRVILTKPKIPVQCKYPQILLQGESWCAVNQLQTSHLHM